MGLRGSQEGFILLDKQQFSTLMYRLIAQFFQQQDGVGLTQKELIVTYSDENMKPRVAYLDKNGALGHISSRVLVIFYETLAMRQIQTIVRLTVQFFYETQSASQ